MSNTILTSEFVNSLLVAIQKCRVAFPGEDARLHTAALLVVGGAVSVDDDCRLWVRSSRCPGVQCHVHGRTCTCPDAPQAPGGRCKHLLAVWLWCRARQARLPALTPEQTAVWQATHSVEVRDERARLGELVATTCTPEWGMRNQGQHCVTAGR